MMEEKQGNFEGLGSLPIPTYEEAISRPSSSQSLGPEYISQDAERQGLLSGGVRRDGYRGPTVESVRSSLDLDDLLQSGANSRSSSTEELRREIDQMEVLEPGAERTQLLARTRFSKRITNLTHTLSSIHLPQFPTWLPSWSYLRERMPSPKPNWIILGRFFALLLVLSLAYLLFLSNFFRAGRNTPGMKWFDPEALRSYVIDHVREDTMRDHLRYLTNYTHIAGTSGGDTSAKYVEALFAEHLEDVGLERFDVYLNYPKTEAGSRKVAIIAPEEMAWEATIDENTVYPGMPMKENSFVFHGHSRSGTVQGPLIYANYGSKEDFQHLLDLGVDITGSIVLIRYYGTQADRSLKVKGAENAGAIGCIIYSDPAKDGFLQGDVFPDGRFMPGDGVQRGSVAITSWVLGDPLTPGYASTPEESRRESKDNNPGLNNIPSIPLAWRDAQRLLQSLKGHGKELDDAWGKGGVPDVDWWSGDSSSPVVLLKNELDEIERRPIYNVLGKITGVEQPEKKIVVGNHRDAWCFGAADPNSGTAVLLEVVRILGGLRDIGWKPLRTIEFASWDAEEYNLVGSTEHVEARIDELRRDGVAYLNVDVATTGSEFHAGASPVLNTALLHVLERVVDPTYNKSLRTVFAESNSKIGGLDAGSDHAPFQMLAGCSSMVMDFGGPAFPYHSCYDNFEWMDRFGDPGFQYHQVMARIWALLILDLSDREILPFDFEAYADAVQGYVDDLEAYSKSKHALDFSPLHDAANEMSENAKQFHEWSQAWANLVYGDNNGFESNNLAIKRISHNTRMANFETNLLDIEGGLPGREQFKHVIFAPQAWDTYGSSYFPGVRDAVDEGNWNLAQQQITKVAEILSYASRKLNN